MRDRQNRRKRLDDAAFGNGAVAAPADDTIEFAAQGGDVRNFAIDLREMLASNGVHVFARAVPLIGKTEQLANLRKRKADRALGG